VSKGFYRAFEDRYRGPRELIVRRLKVYLPFLEAIKDNVADARAVDLGCGRGEWLELLQQNGFDAIGIDQDEGMLAACKERDLRANLGDALSYLRSLPTSSVALVSGFHIAEHLTFSNLQLVVGEALRVLMENGLLILETPNPENVVVATNDFFIDPTHQRPLPTQLLAFLVEHHGFGRVKILRLQESSELANKENLSLWDVLSGASPDFAVIAQKTRAADLTSHEYDSVFEKNFGLDLKTLAVRYEQGLSGRLSDIAAGVARLRFFEQENDRFKAEFERQGRELDDARRQIAAQAADVRRLSERLTVQESEGKERLIAIGERLALRDEELLAIYKSNSWLVTKPLRAISAFLKGFLGGPR
jgi:O-antigen chain-terminating methyltransferase